MILSNNPFHYKNRVSFHDTDAIELDSLEADVVCDDEVCVCVSVIFYVNSQHFTVICKKCKFPI